MTDRFPDAVLQKAWLAAWATPGEFCAEDAAAMRAVLEAHEPVTEYERGRQAVLQELSAAVRRFNEDDSMGIAQLIEVIEPFLVEQP